MRNRIGLLVVVLAVSLGMVSTVFGAQMPKNVLIGVSQIVSHPALDAVVKGIQDELAAEHVKARFDLQNANGDINTASSIAAKFRSEHVNVAVGVATPTAQSLVSTLRNTPIVFAAVTDPVKAGLVRSYKGGDRWVTGASDLTPVKQQIELLLRLKKVKRLGTVYCTSEANAVELAQILKKVCQELHIEYVESTVTKSAEVKEATDAIARRVDALYISTDNTVVSAMSSVADVAMKHRIPIMSADPSSAEQYNVLAAWGFDYYKMGRATGKIIVEILKGKSPAQIPTLFMTKPSDVNLFVNLDVAKKLGIVVPANIVRFAKTVRKNGKLIRK